MNDQTDKWPLDMLDYSARTDVGMRRTINQDSYYASPDANLERRREQGALFIVADGMGAHVAGEKASRLAVSCASDSYYRRTNQSVPDALRDAVMEAHETIRACGESDPAYRDMGTTCDALVLTDGRAYVGHVGDSRVYRARERVVEQLTFDHSLVWEMKYYPTSHSAYRQLQIDNIPKNIITRSLGPTDGLVVDIEGPIATAPGDVFLLCSDGLSGRVEDDELGQILELFPPNDATEALINLANLRGGPDNVTAVVVRVKGRVDSSSEPSAEASKPVVYEKRAPVPLRARLVGAGAALSLIVAACFALANLAGRGTWIAIFGALACFLTGLAIWFARKSLVRAAKPVAQEKLGKGPYARASAAPTEKFANAIGALCDELCEALRVDPQYEPDWDGVEKARAQAREARASENYGGSLRADFTIINYMMREVRKYAQKTQGHERA